MSLMENQAYQANQDARSRQSLLPRDSSSGSLLAKHSMQTSPSAVFRSVPRERDGGCYQSRKKVPNHLSAYYQDLSRNPRASSGAERYQAIMGRKRTVDYDSVPAARMNELDDLDDEFDSPGPGHYAGIYSNSSFTVKPNARFQRMEAGSERWQVRQYNPNLFQEQFVGPGYYEN